MKRLGKLLSDRGSITPEQLSRALAHQRLAGGRLGTCLLETNALEERDLLRGLSEQLHVPFADEEDLRAIPQKTLALLPARAARRCQAIPFRALGGELSLAMIDVRNLALQDELAFVTGRRLKVHIALEARLFEALERYYGEECPRRYVQLVDRLNRTRYLWRGEAAATASEAETATAEPGWSLPPFTAPAPAPPPPLPNPEALSMVPEPPLATAPFGGTTVPLEPLPAMPVPQAPFTGRSVPFSEPAPEPEPVPAAVPAPDQTPVPVSPAQAGEPPSRDAIGAALVARLAVDFSRVLLLAVRANRLTGWLGAGADISLDTLASLAIAPEPTSILTTVRDRAPFFRGPLPNLPSHHALAAVWGGRLPEDCALLPLPVGGRTAALVYLDREPESLGTLDPVALRELLAVAGEQLAAQIRRRKAGSRPASGR